jgi:Asp-tRNA(Asn)/Glu-tRNA(Gln) amidotransferase A subunit family amidase
VERLFNAKCVLLGKTNTPEFGHLPVTINKIFGQTKNPWNLKKTSGGSSGGSAAAIASGLGTLSLGSDGGGSIRIPSSLCGVYGLKTTFGRIPRYPPIGIAFWSMDHYGPIVRYVKDAALMLNVMKGFHPSDKNSYIDEGIDYLEALKNLPKSIKIGYSIDLGFSKAIEPEVEKKVLDSVQKFEKRDWKVQEADIKLKKPEAAFNTLVTLGYAYDLKKDLEKRRDDLSPDLIRMIEAGLSYNAMDIGKAYAVRQETYEVFYKYFEN